MSVNTPGTAAPGSTQPKTPAQEAPVSNSSVFQADTRQRSWAGMMTMGGLARSNSSERLIKAVDALTKSAVIVGKDLSNLDIGLIKIDKSVETGVVVSGVIVTLSWKDKHNTKVVYHTYIIDGTGEIPVLNLPMGGSQVTLQRYAQDAFDADYVAVVQKIMNINFPGAEHVYASASVVPASFQWEDGNAVRNLLVHGAYAGLSKLLPSEKEYMPLDLTQMPRNNTLIGTVGFNNDALIDYVGSPVRADILVRVVATDNTRNAERNSPNAAAQEYPLAQLAGFIDLSWAGAEQNYLQQNVPTQKFVARLVLTWLLSEGAVSLEGQLLALAFGNQLTERNGWLPYYVPNRKLKNGQLDIRDIGALNIEANLNNEPGFGSLWDTKSSSFDDQALGKFVSGAIKPGVAIATDVSICGSDTWHNEVFVAATADGELGKRATMTILNAANTLTGGNFANHYKTDLSPVFSDNELIFTGTYPDPTTGQPRDLRDLDYLAVMNIAGLNDPKVGADWTDTFTRQDIDVALRMKAREGLIKQYLNGAVITGTARRVTWRPEFITALAKAIADCRLDIRSQNAANSMNFSSSRGTASWAEGGRIDPNSSGLFNSGYGRKTSGWGSGYNGQWR